MGQPFPLHRSVIYPPNYLTFQKTVKQQSLNPCTKKVLRQVLKILDQSYFYQLSLKLHAHNNILYKYQSGFCKNHSTDTSLSYLTNKILTDFDSGLLTGMIFMDLQKAFDSINHDILLRKMASLGFSNGSIKWFQLYLSHRSF